MCLSDGLYLGKEICAFCDNWLIVFDGRYNYMLFNAGAEAVLKQYRRNRLPYNDIYDNVKMVAYYSNFDNALGGLCNVLLNPLGFKR